MKKNKNKKLSLIWSEFGVIKKKIPKKIAVQVKDNKYTFEDIYINSKKLSLFLENADRKHIALLFNHGVEMIIAMLAVLKKGFTYIPVDPRLPVNRIQEILIDCEASLLIADSHNINIAYTLNSDVDVIQYTLETTSIFKRKTVKKSVFKVTKTSRKLAYILYTSGSTGIPKGVMQSEDGLLRHIRSYSRSLGITARDNLTLFSAYTFDASIMDIYAAILSGATLFPFDMRKNDITSIPKYLIENKITILHMVPTLFRSFISDINKNHIFKHLRYIVLGGEEVVKSDVLAFRKKFSSQTVLINGYGPTECTVALQYFVKSSDEFAKDKKVPIGIPLQGISYDLLYKNNNKRIGEIILKGKAIALGYWGNTELSKQSFAKCQKTGVNIFHTGDYGYIDKLGNLVCIGRNDNQLKINGCKVNLTEIESILRNNNHVVDAIVVVVTERLNRKIIISFVKLVKKINDYQKKLIQHLNKHLPHYTFPLKVISVDNFPLTLSGKVDRKELIKIYKKNKTTYTQSDKLTCNEKLVSDIYQDVLKIENPPSNKTVNQLGGDSIDMIKIIMKIQEKFNINISLDEFNLNPTVLEVSNFIKQKLTLSENNTKNKIAKKNNILPLSQSQLRYWYRVKNGLPVEALNLIYQINIEGNLNLSIFNNAINYLVSRHDVLRTYFVDNKNEPCQVTVKNLDVKIHFNDISELNFDIQNNQLKDHISCFKSYKFGLDKAPLFTGMIFKLNSTSFLFIYVFHHLITDGWSNDIFLQELLLVYDRLKKNTTMVGLKEAVQYREYVFWEKRDFNKNINVFNKKMNFWREMFDVFCSPEKREIKIVNNDLVSLYTLGINSRMNRNIVDYSLVNNISQFVIYLSLFKFVIYFCTQKQTVCVTTDVTTRELYRFEKTLGLFTNIVPILTKLSPLQTIEHNIMKINQQYLLCYNNRVPFPMLFNNLFPGELKAYDEIFPVAFIFQGSYGDELVSDNLRISKLELLNKYTTRDLIFEVDNADYNSKINIYYKSEKYSVDAIKRIAKLFEAVSQFFDDMLKFKLVDAAKHLTEKNMSKCQASELYF